MLLNITNENGLVRTEVTMIAKQLNVQVCNKGGGV